MKKIILGLVLLFTFCTQSAWALTPFKVQNIRIEGLEREQPETVYTYLPIHRGDVLTTEKSGAAIAALYKTGFFEKISLSREGNTLIVHVVERPTIGKLKVTGNNLIPSDKLLSVMKSVDIAEGHIYNRATLERIKQSLLNQYYQAGRYNARVSIEVSPMPRNRVSVQIKISEGLSTKIRRINFIGNHAFSDSELTKQLTLTTPGLFTFFTQTDQYSTEKMQSSSENLRNFYLDHGYVRYQEKSAQTSMSPDHKSVYLNIVVSEGPQYTIKGYTLTGDFVVPKETLENLITVHPGEVFNRSKIVKTEKAMGEELGNKGYVNATVNVNPVIDDVNHTVFLDFNVKPGKRVYVRHIYFSDNTKTNDEVLRREVQQMESSVVSTPQLEESKRRLNLLPYMKNVEMTLVPVPGHDDLTDVNYKVTENNAAEITGRVGYSQYERFLVGAGINQKNFLGTGKTLALNAQSSRFETFVGGSYTNPYFTPDGISRSLGISYTHYVPGAANVSNSYTSNEFAIADSFSIPIGQERNVLNYVNLGYGYSNTLIHLPAQSYVSNMVQDFVNRKGRHFQQLNLNLGLLRDSRDRYIFPTRGARQALGLDFYLPINASSLRYYIFNYNGVYYHPIVNDFIFMLRGSVGYGNSFTQGNDYPFFRNFYAGGIGSVRGYLTNDLGPRDNLNKPTGGNLLGTASLGLILPSYFSDSIRTTLFLDGGNVYSTYNTKIYGNTATGPLRYSAGVEVTWQSMMGPIDISLARALNSHGQRLEAFQFSLGANFG